MSFCINSRNTNFKQKKKKKDENCSFFSLLTWSCMKFEDMEILDTPFFPTLCRRNGAEMIIIRKLMHWIRSFFYFKCLFSILFVTLVSTPFTRIHSLNNNSFWTQGVYVGRVCVALYSRWACLIPRRNLNGIKRDVKLAQQNTHTHNGQ